ncbi:insulinase family protein [bacterium]|nr:insulinase family protein [bacterium]
MDELNFHELQNGIRIIHKQTAGEVAHCGFIINTGSRDEKIKESGITHFIEHAIFKGTKNRKAHHILNRLDNVGGEINAYTTKENTCIYASFTSNYFKRATELLTDILFNSTFPEKELEKEKDVIIDEIYSYQDSPFEQIYDDFEEQVFKNHSLGMNILGTVDSVKKIQQKNILKFIHDNYQTDQIVFSVVGNVSFKKVLHILTQLLNHIPTKTNKLNRTNFKNYIPSNIEVKKANHQVHCILGNQAYGAMDKKKNGFILLNNILGGPALNSRLNLEIREKYGFTYNIESSYTTYTDTGLFNIYLGTDTKHIEKSIKLVKRELKKLREKQLTPTQLKTAKKQLIGQITLGEESNVNVMLGMGKSILIYNKVDSIKDVHSKIELITASELQDTANEIFDEKQLSTLIYSIKE